MQIGLINHKQNQGKARNAQAPCPRSNLLQDKNRPKMVLKYVCILHSPFALYKSIRYTKCRIAIQPSPHPLLPFDFTLLCRICQIRNTNGVPATPLKNLHYWIASGFMARGLCSTVALAMTLFEATLSTEKPHNIKNVIARATENAQTGIPSPKQSSDIFYIEAN